MSNKSPKIVIPGLNRGAGVPAGYILGRRRGAGQGPAELLNINQLQAIGISTRPFTTQLNSTTGSTAASGTASLSTSVSSQISTITSIDVTQSTSLSQISSSLSGAISSTSSLSTAVSTVISGSISVVNSRIDSLSTAVGSGGTVDVEDEGTPVAAAATLNFIGSGVTATDGGAGVADITIAGGGGGGGSWIPLVNGAEPPVFITNGAGVLILVAGP